MLHHRIAHQVGHQEKVAIAVIQLHLRSRQIIGVQIEKRIHKPLEITLTFDKTADRGVFFIHLQYQIHHLMPITINSCLVIGHV